MLLSPRKSVTRFFIPLIDVLILLFCIFLLMPFVSGPETGQAEPDAKAQEKELPKDVTELRKMLEETTKDLKEERRRVSELEKKYNARLTDRLAVRVLEIDPRDGTLFYYNPAREEVKTDADAERLILRQKAAAGEKDVLFLILFPRTVSNLTVPQIERMRRWFKDVPYAFDIP